LLGQRDQRIAGTNEDAAGPSHGCLIEAGWPEHCRFGWMLANSPQASALKGLNLTPHWDQDAGARSGSPSVMGMRYLQSGDLWPERASLGNCRGTDRLNWEGAQATLRESGIRDEPAADPVRSRAAVDVSGHRVIPPDRGRRYACLALACALRLPRQFLTLASRPGDFLAGRF
jgi:hypothetical protein